MIIAPGATSQSITIHIVDDSGLPVTGLAAATFPTTYYQRAAEAAAAITLADLAAVNSAWSSGGVKEINGGRYRLDVPDAAFATASKIEIIGEATGKRILAHVITCSSIAAPGDAMTLTSGERSTVGTAVWATGTRTLTAFAFSVTVGTNNDKTGYALTSGERTSIANEVEAQIIDDTDSEKVLQAITDKIASVNPSLDDLTLAGIASAVRSELATELARIDAAVSSRASQTTLDTVDDYVDTEVANIVSAVADIQNRIPAALGANGNIKADVRDFGGTAGTSTGGRPEVIVTGDAATAGTRFLTMIQLDAAVYRFTANALEMAPNGEGGVSVNVASFDAGALLQLSALKTITTIGPVVSATKLSIIQGDDYLAVDDRQLIFLNTSGNWPDLTGAAITLHQWRVVNDVPQDVYVSGTVVVPAGVNQRVDVDLPRASSIQLDSEAWKFDLIAVCADGHTLALRVGDTAVRLRPWLTA